MKRTIAFIMSAVLLATTPAGTAFAIESDAVDEILILEEEAELETEVPAIEAESMEEAVEPESENIDDSLLVSVEEISPEDIPEAVSEETAIAEELESGILGSGTCGENLTWTLDEGGTLTISGTGAMYDYGCFLMDGDDINDVSPWFEYFLNGYIRSIVMEDGVTYIGDSAFYYEYDDDEFAKKPVSSIELTIPDTVTGIGECAFAFLPVSNISLPSGLTSIGASAFIDCMSLSEICIPGSVDTIGDSAFVECVCLTKVIVSSGVKHIGEYAFCECLSLSALMLPDSLLSIGASAFDGCRALTDVIFPDSVTTIGDGAFAGCKGLERVTLPENLAAIGNGAFSSCTCLMEINIGEENSLYSSSDGVLFNKDKTELLFCPAGKTGTYEIPDSIVTIGDYAFYGCDGLTGITIPEGVKKIGEYAFAQSAITSITIPDSVTEMGIYAFYWCEDLKSVVLSAGMASISDGAFLECLKLNSIEIPEGVTQIGEAAFYGCTALKSIQIPERVIKIGKTAFYSCTALKSIMIPESVTEVGEEAFARCDALASVTLSSNLKTMGSRVFYDCDSLTTVAIPSGTTTIWEGVFQDCDSLTSVTIPDTVTSIANAAFASCGFTEFTIPDSITEIGESAFACCSKMKSIILPSGLKSIGDYAFAACTSLTDVYYGGSKTDWSAVSIGETNNDPLFAAVIHYNTTESTGSLSSCLISSLTNTSKGITIEWGEVSGADGYYVYRKTASGKYKKIKTIKSASTLKYTDTAVKDKNGVTYLYKVLPYVNGTKGTGKAQTIVRLTGTSITSVTNTASGKIKVKWTSVTGVTGYQVKYESTKKKVSGASKSSVTLTGDFMKGVKYYVRIRTYKKVDGVVYYSAWSSKVFVKITK